MGGFTPPPPHLFSFIQQTLWSTYCVPARNTLRGSRLKGNLEPRGLLRLPSTQGKTASVKTCFTFGPELRAESSGREHTAAFSHSGDSSLKS